MARSIDSPRNATQIDPDRVSERTGQAAHRFTNLITVRPSTLVLLGHPVAHSLSPRMQRAALRAAGIEATYVARDVLPGALATTVAELRTQKHAGNVTIPHKQAMAALCDRLTPAARAAGAVNTFWMDDGALMGDNTDIAGFDAAARALLDARHCDQGELLRVALIGAGGAAAAVAIATQHWRNVQLTVWTRRADAAAAFTQRFAHARASESLLDAASDADLVVNATPVGLDDDALPLPVEMLAADAAVLDLVYRPAETAFVRAARARGHRASDGMAMLVEQGAAAFARWFGIEPDRSVMWEALGRHAPARERAV